MREMFLRHGTTKLRLKPQYRVGAPITESHTNYPRIGLSTSRFFASDSKQASPNEDILVDLESPSSNHHDLKSFLSYTQRSGLDEKSTVYVGTHYEYTVAAKLFQVIGRVLPRRVRCNGLLAVLQRRTTSA
jgi:hypothetical protein